MTRVTNTNMNFQFQVGQQKKKKRDDAVTKKKKKT